MNRFYYDLHVHSCLSPCADNDSTPASLAGMAAVIGLDVVALTDHNSARNCPAFFEAAEAYGIIPIAGMELTTSEDVHMICLFPSLDLALSFNDVVDARLMKVKNRPDIFGEQLICNAEDEVIGQPDNLLSVATDISVEALPSLISEYDGICYPAHIDREANGIVAVLGTLPDEPYFTTVEMRSKELYGEYSERFSLEGRTVVFNSDSHVLGEMNDREHYFDAEAERDDREGVVRELFKRMRCL